MKLEQVLEKTPRVAIRFPSCGHFHAMLKRPSNRALVNPLLVEPIRSDDIGSTSTASVPRHIRLTVPLEWTPGSQLLVKLDGDKRLSVAVPPETAPGSLITVAISDNKSG